MKIVIIGNGIAGSSAARHIRKISNHEIVMISEETDYFFSRTALMYVYMGHMKFEHTQPYENDFWEKNRISLIQGKVTALNTGNRTLEVTGHGEIQYDRLVIATGSKPNFFGWKGQESKGVQGLYFRQDLESMEAFSADTRHAVIVGGGLIGIEMAEMFHSRHIPVTFLVREKSFWNIVLPEEESQMVNRHIRLQKGVNLMLENELKEIIPDENGRVKAIVTGKGETIVCQFVGITAGVHPNTELLKGSDIEVNRGILVNEFLQTNIPEIYAIGDCAELRNPAAHRRPVEAVWYTGKLMAPILAKNICGESVPYIQGVWFNSAKFFEIEYQVYGEINPTLKPEEDTIYWEHPKGDKSIRIVWDKSTQNVKGFNLMGIRYRQEVCEKWIASGTSILSVLENLGTANFDPEFFDEYESELLKKYESQTGIKVHLKRKRGLDSVKALFSGKIVK